MADRGLGRGQGRGGDRGGGPRGGGGYRGRSSSRGRARGGSPSLFRAGTGMTRGGPPSTAGTAGATEGRGRGAEQGARGGPHGQSGGGVVVAADAPPSITVSPARSVPALIGNPRPSNGVPVDIVNGFKADVPPNKIYHYDITILPEDKELPLKVTMEIIRKMQEQDPTIFTKRGSYDGRKNLYSPIRYSFGDTAQFEVTDDARRNPWRVRIKYAATIDPSSTALDIQGRMSHDESVLTTLNAYNDAIRMQPIEDHPFNSRSFFTRDEFKNIGQGIELWRGHSRSVRPPIGKMKPDISSAVFYKSGSLIELCLEYLGKSPDADPVPYLAARRLDRETREKLLEFVRHLNVRTTPGPESRVRAIQDISETGADSFWFKKADGEMVSIQSFFAQSTGRHLRYPTLICVRISSTAWIPIECCDVIPGQFCRKTPSADQTKQMVEFSRSLRSED